MPARGFRAQVGTARNREGTLRVTRGTFIFLQVSFVTSQKKYSDFHALEVSFVTSQRKYEDFHALEVFFATS